MKRFLLFMLLCIATVTMSTSCSKDYSEGWRTGTVSKFSEKGIIFKTWEGELHLGGISGGEANVWQFSIDAERERSEDIDSLVTLINIAMEHGDKVRLHYNEEAGLIDLNMSRGTTHYYIDKVQIIQKE